MKVLFLRLWVDVTNKKSITHPKEEEIRLPVGVRGSKIESLSKDFFKSHRRQLEVEFSSSRLEYVIDLLFLTSTYKP